MKIQPRKQIVWFILSAIVLWASLLAAHPNQTEYIPPRDYYSTVQRELVKAKKSITVCMYLFTFQPHQSKSLVFQLADRLIKAHDAGVRVEVILDQNINFIEGDERGDDLMEGKNAVAYRFLKAQGIPVYYDDSSTYLHSKAVVIDEETVIAGSTNWSESALTRNQEINFLIRSKEVAHAVLATIRAIPRHAPRSKTDADTVDIPGAFLEEFLAPMTKHSDERAFDTYLYILEKSTGPFLLDYDELARSLGLNGNDRASFRKQINKVLTKLDHRYGLIEVETAFNKEALITPVALPSDRSAPMPRSYWTHGWNRRLSFAGKTALLISHFESGVSTRRPRWSAARKTLNRRYGVSMGFMSQGVTDLRRNNLLEVDYAPYTSHTTQPRRPPLYTPNPLYNPADRDTRMEELKTRYGPDKFARAQRAVVAVYEDSDTNGIKELMDLETEYGVGPIEAAVNLVEQKNPDNPARTLGYLIGTIRNIGKTRR